MNCQIHQILLEAPWVMLMAFCMLVAHQISFWCTHACLLPPAERRSQRLCFCLIPKLSVSVRSSEFTREHGYFHVGSAKWRTKWNTLEIIYKSRWVAKNYCQRQYDCWKAREKWSKSRKFLYLDCFVNVLSSYITLKKQKIKVREVVLWM